jgi:peptidoglycan/LPS O-acetylase OafA/YrhL
VLKDFFLKRFARLYPVYVVTTLIALLMFIFAKVIGHTFGKLSAEVLTISNVAKNLFAIQILDNSASLNYPSWSVSAEFFAYFIFPLLIYSLFIKIQRTRFVAGILFLLSLFIYEGQVFFDFFANDPIIKAVTEFVMGMTCYLWIRKMSFRREYVVIMRFVSTFILICFLLFVENGVVVPALMPLLLLVIIALNFFHNIQD